MALYDARLLREDEIRPVLEWDPASSAAAETNAENGDFSTVGDLVDHLLTDDRVRGCLQQLAAIMRLPVDFTSGHPEFVRSLRDDGDFWRMFPTGELRRFIGWKCLLNVALGRLEWVNPDGSIRKRGSHYIPRARGWSARNLTYEVLTGRWWTYVGQSYTREQVTPGQNGWLLWTGTGSRPWADGAWRAVRAWVLLKDYARIDMARFGERLGQGIIDVAVPPGLIDTKAKRAALARELKEIGSRGIFVRGTDWKTGIIESQARTWEVYKAQVELANLGIAVAMLGQNLTTEVDAGAKASTTVHKSVAAEIIASVAEEASDFQHDQVLEPVAVAEYGRADAAPYPEYDSATPIDRDSTVKTWQGFGAFLRDARDTGIDRLMNLREAGERAGIPWRADARDAEFALKDAPTPPANPFRPDPDEPLVKPKTKQAIDRVISLASGDDPSVAQGMVDGQLYVDRVVESLGSEMVVANRPFLNRVLQIIAEVDDQGELYDRLIEAFADDRSARELGELIQAAMTMASLAGVGSVHVDAGTAPSPP
jgi:hypothetical protein